MRFKKIILIISATLIILVLGFFLWNFMANRNTEYIDQDSQLSFAHPMAWGAPQISPGNTICPEEDTYRTPETLLIFDRELRFEDRDLKDTESFIRSGIRFYKMDPSKSNGCNDDVLRVLANKEMTGEEFSSFRLVSASIPEFYGVYNESASRLDTEWREQYTLFKKEPEGAILVVQPYLSFVPYADSPEWQEIDQNFKGDILSFIKNGISAEEERIFGERFREMAQSLKFISI